MRALLALALFAAPAVAQDVSPLDACLDGGADPASCIGVVAAPCIEAAGGEATAVAACYREEDTAWMARLDAALTVLKTDAEAADAIADEAAAEAAENVDRKATMGFPVYPRPSRAEALSQAQNAWLAWATAECRWHSLGFDPQAAQAAEAECHMQRVAERVLALEPRGMAVDGP